MYGLPRLFSSCPSEADSTRPSTAVSCFGAEIPFQKTPAGVPPSPFFSSFPPPPSVSSPAFSLCASAFLSPPCVPATSAGVSAAPGVSSASPASLEEHLRLLHLGNQQLIREELERASSSRLSSSYSRGQSAPPWPSSASLLSESCGAAPANREGPTAGAGERSSWVRARSADASLPARPGCPPAALGSCRDTGESAEGEGVLVVSGEAGTVNSVRCSFARGSTSHMQPGPSFGASGNHCLPPGPQAALPLLAQSKPAVACLSSSSVFAASKSPLVRSSSLPSSSSFSPSPLRSSSSLTSSPAVPQPDSAGSSRICAGASPSSGAPTRSESAHAPGGSRSQPRLVYVHPNAPGATPDVFVVVTPSPTAVRRTNSESQLCGTSPESVTCPAPLPQGGAAPGCFLSSSFSQRLTSKEGGEGGAAPSVTRLSQEVPSVLEFLHSQAADAPSATSSVPSSGASSCKLLASSTPPVSAGYPVSSASSASSAPTVSSLRPSLSSAGASAGGLLHSGAFAEASKDRQDCSRGEAAEFQRLAQSVSLVASAAPRPPVSRSPSPYTQPHQLWGAACSTPPLDSALSLSPASQACASKPHLVQALDLHCSAVSAAELRVHPKGSGASGARCASLPRAYVHQTAGRVSEEVPGRPLESLLPLREWPQTKLVAEKDETDASESSFLSSSPDAPRERGLEVLRLQVCGSVASDRTSPEREEDTACATFKASSEDGAFQHPRESYSPCDDAVLDSSLPEVSSSPLSRQSPIAASVSHDDVEARVSSLAPRRLKKHKRAESTHASQPSRACSLLPSSASSVSSSSSSFPPVSARAREEPARVARRSASKTARRGSTDSSVLPHPSRASASREKQTAGVPLALACRREKAGDRCTSSAVGGSARGPSSGVRAAALRETPLAGSRRVSLSESRDEQRERRLRGRPLAPEAKAKNAAVGERRSLSFSRAFAPSAAASSSSPRLVRDAHAHGEHEARQLRLEPRKAPRAGQAGGEPEKRRTETRDSVEKTQQEEARAEREAEVRVLAGTRNEEEAISRSGQDVEEVKDELEASLLDGCLVDEESLPSCLVDLRPPEDCELPRESQLALLTTTASSRRASFRQGSTSEELCRETDKERAGGERESSRETERDGARETEQTGEGEERSLANEAGTSNKRERANDAETSEASAEGPQKNAEDWALSFLDCPGIGVSIHLTEAQATPRAEGRDSERQRQGATRAREAQQEPSSPRGGEATHETRRKDEGEEGENASWTDEERETKEAGVKGEELATGGGGNCQTRGKKHFAKVQVSDSPASTPANGADAPCEETVMPRLSPPERECAVDKDRQQVDATKTASVRETAEEINITQAPEEDAAELLGSSTVFSQASQGEEDGAGRRPMKAISELERENQLDEGEEPSLRRGERVRERPSLSLTDLKSLARSELDEEELWPSEDLRRRSPLFEGDMSIPRSPTEAPPSPPASLCSSPQPPPLPQLNSLSHGRQHSWTSSGSVSSASVPSLTSCFSSSSSSWSSSSSFLGGGSEQDAPLRPSSAFAPATSAAPLWGPFTSASPPPVRFPSPPSPSFSSSASSSSASSSSASSSSASSSSASSSSASSSSASSSSASSSSASSASSSSSTGILNRKLREPVPSLRSNFFVARDRCEPGTLSPLSPSALSPLSPSADAASAALLRSVPSPTFARDKTSTSKQTPCREPPEKDEASLSQAEGNTIDPSSEGEKDEGGGELREGRQAEEAAAEGRRESEDCHEQETGGEMEGGETSAEEDREAVRERKASTGAERGNSPRTGRGVHTPSGSVSPCSSDSTVSPALFLPLPRQPESSIDRQMQEILSAEEASLRTLLSPPPSPASSCMRGASPGRLGAHLGSSVSAPTAPRGREIDIFCGDANMQCSRASEDDEAFEESLEELREVSALQLRVRVWREKFWTLKRLDREKDRVIGEQVEQLRASEVLFLQMVGENETKLEHEREVHAQELARIAAELAGLQTVCERERAERDAERAEVDVQHSAQLAEARARLADALREKAEEGAALRRALQEAEANLRRQQEREAEARRKHAEGLAAERGHREAARDETERLRKELEETCAALLREVEERGEERRRRESERDVERAEHAEKQRQICELRENEKKRQREVEELERRVAEQRAREAALLRQIENQEDQLQNQQSLLEEQAKLLVEQQEELLEMQRRCSQIESERREKGSDDGGQEPRDFGELPGQQTKESAERCNAAKDGNDDRDRGERETERDDELERTEDEGDEGKQRLQAELAETREELRSAKEVIRALQEAHTQALEESRSLRGELEIRQKPEKQELARETQTPDTCDTPSDREGRSSHRSSQERDRSSEGGREPRREKEARQGERVASLEDEKEAALSLRIQREYEEENIKLREEMKRHREEAKARVALEEELRQQLQILKGQKEELEETTQWTERRAAYLLRVHRQLQEDLEAAKEELALYRRAREASDKGGSIDADQPVKPRHRESERSETKGAAESGRSTVAELQREVKRLEKRLADAQGVVAQEKAASATAREKLLREETEARRFAAEAARLAEANRELQRLVASCRRLHRGEQEEDDPHATRLVSPEPAGADEALAGDGEVRLSGRASGGERGASRFSRRASPSPPSAEVCARVDDGVGFADLREETADSVGVVALQQQLKQTTASAMARERLLQTRIRTLQQQLESQRSYYHKRLTNLSVGSRHPTAPSSSSSCPSSSSRASAGVRVSRSRTREETAYISRSGSLESGGEKERIESEKGEESRRHLSVCSRAIQVDSVDVSPTREDEESEARCLSLQRERLFPLLYRENPAIATLFTFWLLAQRLYFSRVSSSSSAPTSAAGETCLEREGVNLGGQGGSRDREDGRCEVPFDRRVEFLVAFLFPPVPRQDEQEERIGFDAFEKALRRVGCAASESDALAAWTVVATPEESAGKDAGGAQDAKGNATAIRERTVSRERLTQRARQTDPSFLFLSYCALARRSKLQKQELHVLSATNQALLHAAQEQQEVLRRQRELDAEKRRDAQNLFEKKINLCIAQAAQQQREYQRHIALLDQQLRRRTAESSASAYKQRATGAENGEEEQKDESRKETEENRREREERKACSSSLPAAHAVPQTSYATLLQQADEALELQLRLLRENVNLREKLQKPAAPEREVYVHPTRERLAACPARDEREHIEAEAMLAALGAELDTLSRDVEGEIEARVAEACESLSLETCPL
ncbi:hypothetical protein TGGT1_204380 [Toxoplasma gondii GT1]|uniref:Uncharacterized protein n=3 Tax=Toxoplasma gondii TaxID=5811 RepID=S7WA09_TOXGG|nr:hypothetical protein TGGT1_204380 [Toxoplasma gondii GT1]KAF4642748.1 hypothetical protein TGRH88_034740 [Toxoplasma gondii]KFG39639.1 hypothetical protein TGFOU_204380 [Toxoplasma gondii FOU]